MRQELDYLTATVDLERIAAEPWDAAVVGAGPAGALAAYHLALNGAAVLLIEKSNFPRAKICGCCLNMSTLGTLTRAGLGDLPDRLGARSLKGVEIHLESGTARLPLPGGACVSREAFDAALVGEAVGAGATFLHHTRAVLDEQIGNSRNVHLRAGRETALVRAKVVLVADGLAGTSLTRLPEFATAVRRESHIGAGVILDDATGYEREGTIFMACGRGGYVGAVVLEDGRLNLAAALDRRFTRDQSGVAELAARILREANLPPLEEITRRPWRGTPALTRKRRRVAGHRVFVLGDAAGYVEPFTGEGIAWALISATVIAPLALETVSGFKPELAQQWGRLYRGFIGRRQRVCKVVSAMLKRPWMARSALSLLAPLPWLAAPWVRSVNTPPSLSST